jgi:predicted dehydrogenase
MKRAAVVGFGFMGMTHSLNILRNKDLKLVAIVDANPTLIEKNLNAKTGNFATGNIDARELAGIHKYSDLEDCLHSEDLDAVIICVHSGLHYEMTRKALLHDKHVFLEKPLCLDISQGEELISLAEQKKRILMVGHVVRFMPPYQKLKQWIDSKEFGTLKFLSLSRFCGLPGWGQWKERHIKDASGGALFDLVIHDIDFANYLLGLPLDIKCSYLPGEYSKHDYITAMWSYKDKNVHVKIEGGFIFHSSFPFQAGYMAQFEKASVLYTSFKGDIIQIADDNSVKEVPAGDSGAGYYNEIAYFTGCLKSNTRPEECLPASSLQAIQLCYNHL